MRSKRTRRRQVFVARLSDPRAEMGPMSASILHRPRRSHASAAVPHDDAYDRRPRRPPTVIFRRSSRHPRSLLRNGILGSLDNVGSVWQNPRMRPPDVQYAATADGTEIAYLDFGEGEPIVWI